jgi:hypothetical protein
MAMQALHEQYPESMNMYRRYVHAILPNGVIIEVSVLQSNIQVIGFEHQYVYCIIIL